MSEQLPEAVAEQPLKLIPSSLRIRCGATSEAAAEQPLKLCYHNDQHWLTSLQIRVDKKTESIIYTTSCRDESNVRETCPSQGVMMRGEGVLLLGLVHLRDTLFLHCTVIVVHHFLCLLLDRTL